MIRAFVPILALLLSLAFPAAAQTALSDQDARTLQAGLSATLDGFALPAYEDQAFAAQGLSEALEAHCAGPADLPAVRDAYAETFLAWQRASLIQMGPVRDAEGPARVQLWPDAKDFARRAITAALRAEDPALLTPGGLTGRSVALTNLTALEDLVAGELPPGSYACDLARAIAAHQAALAEGFAAALTPGSDYRALIDGAVDGNDRYPSVEAAIRQMLSGAVVQVDRLRKFKLMRGLGAAPGEARPERTEARAMGLGLPSIEATFRGLADLYDVPGGLFDAAPTLGGTMEYVTLAQTAENVADTLAFNPRTLAQIAEEDGAEAETLRGYAELALYHEAYLKTGFLSSIGLTSGFTAADGD
ncbi:MAG: imelysin family protein [Paracoccaceae bacterium]